MVLAPKKIARPEAGLSRIVATKTESKSGAPEPWELVKEGARSGFGQLETVFQK